MSIQAHPDDRDFIFAGTLAKWAVAYLSAKCHPLLGTSKSMKLLTTEPETKIQNVIPV